MRHPFSNQFEGRPSGSETESVKLPGRLFQCALCRGPALVCSDCDTGQIYCAGGCADAARRESMRNAGKRYQATPKGRRAHAARQNRYRNKSLAMTRAVPRCVPPSHQITTASTQDAAPAVTAAGAIPPRDDGRRPLGRELHGDGPDEASHCGRRSDAERPNTGHIKQIVTHHASPPRLTYDLVPLDWVGTRYSPCGWCERPCSRSVRSDSLRRRRRRSD